MIETASDAPTVTVDACPLCHSPPHTTLRREPPYELRRCAACGLGYVTPRRTAAGLAAMYSEEVYWRSPAASRHGYADYRSEAGRRERTFTRRLNRVLGAGPDAGRALDVGAAAGFGMAALSRRGFDAYGVEISAVIAAHAQVTLGYGDRVHVAAFEDVALEPASFGLITMWDLLEHLPDPAGALRHARALLAPAGRLVIGAQDLDSALTRLLGRRGHRFKLAEHIHHFTPSTLRRLLTGAGFVPESLTHRHGGRYLPVAGRDRYLNPMDEMIAVAKAGPHGH